MENEIRRAHSCRDWTPGTQVPLRRSLHDSALELSLLDTPGAVEIPKTGKAERVSVRSEGFRLSDRKNSPDIQILKPISGARLLSKGTLIKQRLVDEQERLRALRGTGHRKSDKTDVDEFEAMQSAALRRISILEQRLAQQETVCTNRFDCAANS